MDELVDELYRQVQQGEQVVATAHKIATRARINPSGLIGSFYRHTPHPERHRNFLLSPEEEEKLALAALAMSTLNEDWSVEQTIEAAMIMFDIKMSDDAVLGFRERQKERMSLQLPKTLGKKREDPTIYDEVVHWVSLMSTYLERHRFITVQIVNYDECRIVFNNTQGLWVKRLVSRKKKKPQNKSRSKHTHIGTYLPFVSANGEHLASFFIFPASFSSAEPTQVKITLPSSIQHTRSAPEQPIILFNETGYLKKEDFEIIMTKFELIWGNRHPGLHCCLIGDNLKAHRNLPIVARAMAHDIFMTFLVADTTHWSQPLDNLLFALLKQQCRKLGAKLKNLQIHSHEDLISIVHILMEASHFAFARDYLIEAFQKCGLWPFDAALIKKLAAMNHDPSKSEEIYTEKDDIMVHEIVKGLVDVQKHTMTEVHQAERDTTSVAVKVKPHVAYTVEDLLEQDKEKKRKKDLESQQKEQNRIAREQERKRKAEEKEEAKNEQKRRRLEQKALLAQRLAEKKAAREKKLCKAGCGRHWVTGTEWIGCEYCDDYWVCPTCWKKRGPKIMVGKHEKKCSK